MHFNIQAQKKGVLKHTPLTISIKLIKDLC